MAQKSKPKTSLKASFHHFEGVDTRKTHSGDESVARIDNFRIREDGSLEKRCGFRHVLSAGEHIRGSYFRLVDGKRLYYFVASSNVYLKINDDEPLVIGKVARGSAQLHFFEYLNRLYLFDGSSTYYLTDSEAAIAHPYIPIYGKDWVGGYAGEQYEKLNLLTDKVMITHKLAANPSGFLSLGLLDVHTVHSVRKNETCLLPSEYTYNEAFNMVELLEYAEGDSVEVIVGINPPSEYIRQRKELLSMQGSSIFHEFSKDNLFLWGSASSNSVYYTQAVIEENLALVNLSAPLTDAFYVPEGTYFSVASPQDRINSIIRHYDRVMIMTDKATWMTDPASLERGNFQMSNVNSSIGCGVVNGALRIENTLISIGKDAVYSWTAETDELNESNAYSISEPIKELLPKYFFETCSMLLHRRRREIWFYSVICEEVWIYSLSKRVWYSFSGFAPDTLFADVEEIGFTNGSHAYLFDSDLTVDVYKDSTASISANFTSGNLEFNTPARKKLSSLSLRGELSEGSVDIKVLLDGKTTLSDTVSLDENHGVVTFRFKSSGFRSLTLFLSTQAVGRHIIHGVELEAK